MQPATKDQIDLATLNRALTGTRFAGGVQHFAAIGSTSTALLEAAASGATEGVVYIADEQTAGRGRGAHAWHSAAGDGLYLSALAKPPLALKNALHLSLATGLAVQQAVHEITAVSLDIRWPNDLLVGGKKLGGILVETAVDPGDDPALRYAVIGIGINVHHAAFPLEISALATSLAQQEPVSQLYRQPLVISILRQLDLELNRLERGDPRLLQRFEEYSGWVRGRRVHVPEQGGYTGTTSGLDSRGYLLVDSDDGVQRTVLSGGVRDL
jgi:BirA family biotin operon repressor/biotin-[acetyl-CoA-carboxylase] ligase